MATNTSGATTRIAVPDRARELARPIRPDYADAFTVDTTAAPVTRTPREWMHTATVQLPALFAFVRVAHRLIGLKLGPADSPEHLLGWAVTRSTDDEVVLAAEGLLGSCRVIGLASGGQFVLSTLVERNGLIGRVLWAITGPVHRFVVVQVVGRTVRRAVRG